MNKLIIENRTALSDIESLDLVSRVIEEGRVSNDNKQYCYVSIGNINHSSYAISTDLNKKSDRFVIMYNK